MTDALTPAAPVPSEPKRRRRRRRKGLGLRIAQRLGGAVLLLLALSLLCFLLIGLMPGDPIDVMAAGDPNMTRADIERLRALQGLDQPLIERYLAWLGSALQGDLGDSRLHGGPVTDLLAERMTATMLLMGLSFLCALAIALPLGIFAALNAGSVFDDGVNLLCFAGISTPPFWLALILIIAFAAQLGWFPASGMPPAADTGDVWAHLHHLFLPVATLTLASIGDYVRYTRASMIETMRSEHVRAARAKGLTRFGVALRHGLRNALIPVVTIIALQFGALFSGALVTEIMFGYLGMGKTIYDAVMGSDYNLAMAGLLTAGGFVILGNMLADMAYFLLDPRISQR